MVSGRIDAVGPAQPGQASREICGRMRAVAEAARVPITDRDFSQQTARSVVPRTHSA
jgi:hypothetical protein